MSIHRIDYLHWAKTHRRCRYELTSSGVAAVESGDSELTADGVSLTIRGAYGDPELVDLIAAAYGTAAENVLPVTGASTANFLAVACATESSGSILVESPAYEPLVRTPEFLGLEVARFDRTPQRGFEPDLDQVRRGLEKGAKAVLVSDPHNPSGLLCPFGVLEELSQLCARHSAYLIVDEVYRDYAHVNRSKPRWTAFALGSNVIATNSLTKVYGFGGLRAGWIIGSVALIQKARRVIDHLCVDLPAPTSDLAIRIFRRIDRFAARTRAAYDEGFPLLSRWLASRPELHTYGNDGALFCYVRLPKGVSADALCTVLVEQYDTRVVPGSFFDQPDHIRIGFAVPRDQLEEGLRRIGLAIDGIIGESNHANG